MVEEINALSIGAPMMWPEEILVMQRLLKTVKSTYLEFGSGGSTLLAVESGVSRIISVESDPLWARSVAQHSQLSSKVADKSATILYINIGPVTKYSGPASTKSMSEWPAYIATPWQECSAQGVFPDLILVDGRFRVACCLSVAVARTLMGYSAEDPVVVLHDVVPGRKTYKTILDFFEVIQEVRTLQVLKIKPKVDLIHAYVRLLEAQFDAT